MALDFVTSAEWGDGEPNGQSQILEPGADLIRFVTSEMLNCDTADEFLEGPIVFSEQD